MVDSQEKESKNPSLETRDETKRLLREYYQRLTKLGIETIERGTRLQHAKWMCLVAEGIDDAERANRWLGFVQGWLVVENIFSIDECRAHTRNGRVTTDDGTRRNKSL